MVLFILYCNIDIISIIIIIIIFEFVKSKTNAASYKFRRVSL